MYFKEEKFLFIFIMEDLLNRAIMQPASYSRNASGIPIVVLNIPKNKVPACGRHA
jgi:hypothetical protein